MFNLEGEDVSVVLYSHTLVDIQNSRRQGYGVLTNLACHTEPLPSQLFSFLFVLFFAAHFDIIHQSTQSMESESCKCKVDTEIKREARTDVAKCAKIGN